MTRFSPEQAENILTSRISVDYTEHARFVIRRFNNPDSSVEIEDTSIEQRKLAHQAYVDRVYPQVN